MGTYAALHGANLTSYDVLTSDGWLLGVHRVQNMEIFDPKLSTPVLLCHGFAAASFDYLSNRRNESLGFLLADQGYDVWMINFRANRFSNRKMTSDRTITPPTPEDYLRVSFQYMAERDIPAVVDKILEETEQDAIYAVGYSMGGTSMFAMLSENHKYDDKILHFVALAPVLRTGPDASFKTRTLFSIAPAITFLMSAKSVFTTFFGRQILSTASLSDFDSTSSTECQMFPLLCQAFLNMVIITQPGLGYSHLASLRNGIRSSMIPSGFTLMTAYHFTQGYSRGNLAKLDFRSIPQSGIRNIDEYGSDEPPVYDIGGVRVNYSVIFTTNDMISGVQTAKKVIDYLNIEPENYKLVNDFTHLDVIWGWDSRCWIFDDIVERFNNIEMTRGQERIEYRGRAVAYVESLNLENNCDQIVASGES
ncbi:lipase member J [Galendromus occidentalis]|uniref:Lipase member J n=1 Tax=Galendromus occidentalis TaxID=34638 RepID=A0AAJ7SIQ1_9ACAR|nr:lipase member J [Galendromus occidentalis]